LKKTSLKPYNSFGVNAYAADFIEIESEKDIVSFLEKNKNQGFISSWWWNKYIIQKRH